MLPCMSRAVRCALTTLAVPLLQSALIAEITIAPPSAGEVIGSNVFIEYASSSLTDDVTVTATDVVNIGTIHVKVTGSYAIVNVAATGSLFSITKDHESTGELRLGSVVVALDIGVDSMTDRGVIEADYINTIEVDRNIYADILVSGATEAHADNAINTIRVTDVNFDADADGGLWGNVVAGSSNTLHRGRIGTIDINNTIGGRQPTLIRAKEIGSITAGHLTTVDIDLLTFSNSPQRLGSLTTNLGGWGGDVPKGDPPPGTLTDGGFLRAREVTGVINILKNFRAQIEMADPQHPQDRWLIGGTFMADGKIILPDEGLTHQIIVNRNDDGGEWLGKVVVGTGVNEVELDGSAITDGEYAELASDLGGGSVGLATFRIHDSSSTPPHGGTLLRTKMIVNGLEEPMCVAEEDFDNVHIRFYGPISKEGTHDNHVIVERWDTGLDDWQPYNSFVNVILSGPINNERSLSIVHVGSLWPFGLYRARSVTGRLVSRYVLEDPDVVPFVHEFTIADGCAPLLLQNFDFNNDDTLCAADLTAWTADPVDLNGDSVIDGDDVLLLMNAIDLYDIITSD